jgi:urease accessory protein
MNLTALLLADSRFPGGGHTHSGGLEEAAARHLVSTEDDLPAFLLGRLNTSGALAAIFAAASAHAARRGVPPTFWAELDAELDARTPSAAQREASRAQGSGTLRALLVGSRCPEGRLQDTQRPQGVLQGMPGCLGVLGRRPHHCVVVGAAVGLGGGLPVEAALTAAYLSVSGPATAAVRLLGLDPLVVNGFVAALGPDIRGTAEWAADLAAVSPAELPAPGAPGLDFLAEAHRQKEVRLFAS